MADIAYTEFRDEEVQKFINGVLKNTDDIKQHKKKYIGLLSAIVYSDINTHFKEQKGSEGSWKDWSTSYTKHMEKIGRSGNMILQFNGKLRNNFKPTDVKSSSKGIMWFNDAKTKKGFPYAAAHDKGGPKLPKRDFMWLSDSSMEKISVQTLQFMIDEGI